MRQRKIGRAFIGKVLPHCDHPLLIDAFYWGPDLGWFGTCLDFDCGSTVNEERPDGSKRKIVSYRRERNRNMNEVA